MDYHAAHGYDVSSFDLPSTHRLPTVSAADALDELDGDCSRFISTGYEELDRSLAAAGLGENDLKNGGIQRGQVTEIWGPPGAGKTALGIQLAASALGNRRGVVWVDCFHPICVQRLQSVLQAGTRHRDEKGFDHMQDFVHYACSDLPHLIALLCRPTPTSIPQNTSLIVIDSLSALVNHAFPKIPEPKPTHNANGAKGPTSGARRLQVLQYVVGAFQKLGAMRDIAVVVLNQCATRMQAERGASLAPAINASTWDQGVSARLVLYRDWILEADQNLRGVHFVGIQKLHGKTADTAFVNDVAAFDITAEGLVPVSFDTDQPPVALSSTPTQKRKLRSTGFEIPDSEDEDYGWQDEDAEEMPNNPSQWQGSEDILLSRAEDESEADETEEAVDEQLTESGDGQHIDLGGPDSPQSTGKKEIPINAGDGPQTEPGD